MSSQQAIRAHDLARSAGPWVSPNNPRSLAQRVRRLEDRSGQAGEGAGAQEQPVEAGRGGTHVDKLILEEAAEGNFSAQRADG